MRGNDGPILELRGAYYKLVKIKGKWLKCISFVEKKSVGGRLKFLLLVNNLFDVCLIPLTEDH